jgi:hypothetical protein
MATDHVREDKTKSCAAQGRRTATAVAHPFWCTAAPTHNSTRPNDQDRIPRARAAEHVVGRVWLLPFPT